MKAKFILVRFMGAGVPSGNNYLLEIYTDSIPKYISVDTHLVYNIVALAKMLDCPIRLWSHNPEAFSEAVIISARQDGVEIQRVE